MGEIRDDMAMAERLRVYASATTKVQRSWGCDDVTLCIASADDVLHAAAALDAVARVRALLDSPLVYFALADYPLGESKEFNAGFWTARNGIRRALDGDAASPSTARDAGTEDDHGK